MTRGNARELAVHLIYGRAFTGEEPEQVISTRMEKEYYAQLAEENDVYSDRPSRAQLRIKPAAPVDKHQRPSTLSNSESVAALPTITHGIKKFQYVS